MIQANIEALRILANSPVPEDPDESDAWSFALVHQAMIVACLTRDAEMQEFMKEGRLLDKVSQATDLVDECIEDFADLFWGGEQ